MNFTKLVAMTAVLFLCFPVVNNLFVTLLGLALGAVTIAFAAYVIIDAKKNKDVIDDQITQQHEAVLERIYRLDGKLEALEDIAAYVQQIDTPARMELEEFVAKLAKFFDVSTKVELFYKRYKEFSNATVQPSDRMLFEFSSSVMTHDSRSPRYLVVHAFRLLKDKHAMLDLSLNPEVNNYIMCSRNGMSTALFMQLLVFQAVDLEMMTVVMLSYSMDYLQDTNRTNGTLRQHYIDHLTEMRERIVELVRIVQEQPKQSIGHLWTCDSKYNKIGKPDALQFTSFLDTIHARIPLYEDCMRPFIEKSNIIQSYERRCGISHYSYTKRNKCNGKVTTCRSLPPRSLSICLSDSPYRRFDKIDVHGKRHGCSGEIVIRHHNFCKHCFCICDAFNDKESIRFISTEMVTSDTIHNRVITGAQFAIKDRTVALKLRETEVNKDGTLNTSTHNWIVGKHGNRNYYKFTSDNRRLHMNSLVGSYGYFVTGAGFQLSPDGIYLQLQITPYEDKTFRLIETHRTVNPYNPKANSKIDVENKQLPFAAPHAPSVYVFTDSFVEFTTSSFEDDSGQTTVPFFDGRPVESLLPLEGLGLFYKMSSHKYSGYIAPTLIPMDLSKRLKKMLPYDFDELLPLIQNKSLSSSAQTDYYSPLMIILLFIATLLPWL